MHYDMQMLFILVGIGLAAKKVNWKGWLLICGLILTWMVYNLYRGASTT